MQPDELFFINVSGDYQMDARDLVAALGEQCELYSRACSYIMWSLQVFVTATEGSG